MRLTILEMQKIYCIYGASFIDFTLTERIRNRKGKVKRKLNKTTGKIL